MPPTKSILLVIQILIFPLMAEDRANLNLRLTLIPLEQFLIPPGNLDKYGYFDGGETMGSKDGGECFFEWIPVGEWSECSEECGGCGRRWRQRECRQRGRGPEGKETVECGGECQGPELEEELCNFDVCLYPKQPTCCPPLVPSSVKGNFTCAFLQTNLDEGNRNESRNELAKQEFLLDN